jgi:hypothetical protein
MQEGEDREPGTILLWLGVCITVPSALLLVYMAVTYPITISIDDAQTKIVRSIGGPLLLTLVGIIIAASGFVIRHRHRRSALSDPARDTD